VIPLNHRYLSPLIYHKFPCSLLYTMTLLLPPLTFKANIVHLSKFHKTLFMNVTLKISAHRRGTHLIRGKCLWQWQKTNLHNNHWTQSEYLIFFCNTYCDGTQSTNHWLLWKLEFFRFRLQLPRIKWGPLIWFFLVKGEYWYLYYTYYIVKSPILYEQTKKDNWQRT